jgi:hypothetical protein
MTYQPRKTRERARGSTGVFGCMFLTVAVCLIIPVMNGTACGNRSASVPELTDQSNRDRDNSPSDEPKKPPIKTEQYSRLLAERDSEIERLGQLLLQYEQALSNREQQLLQYQQWQMMIEQQWLQDPYSQQQHQGVGNYGVHVGPRGGRFTYTASGKKRYLSSSKSSSGSSRKRK